MYEKFKSECRDNYKKMSSDEEFNNLSKKWMNTSFAHKYSYNFEWLGRPIIQYPQDIVAMQEIIWQVKPDLIIETGIAHGGSLIFSASQLALIDLCHNKSTSLDHINRSVVGVDIEIRKHNRIAIEEHPLSSYITMIEGSSIDQATADKVYELAKGKQRVLVCLDSNHTHDHVMKELALYADLVSKNSYCVVFDTVVAEMEDSHFTDREWGNALNPMSAVKEWLGSNKHFEVDTDIDAKLQLSVAPNGYLKRLK